VCGASRGVENLKGTIFFVAIMNKTSQTTNFHRLPVASCQLLHTVFTGALKKAVKGGSLEALRELLL
jgi:hypothetical protein